jgi:hypothetical protein
MSAIANNCNKSEYTLKSWVFRHRLKILYTETYTIHFQIPEERPTTETKDRRLSGQLHRRICKVHWIFGEIWQFTRIWLGLQRSELLPVLLFGCACCCICSDFFQSLFGDPDLTHFIYQASVGVKEAESIVIVFVCVIKLCSIFKLCWL